MTDRWFPIREAPRDGIPFDALDIDGVEHYNVVYQSDGMGEWLDYSFTHWRPTSRSTSPEDERDRQRNVLSASGGGVGLYDRLHDILFRLTALKRRSWDRHVPLGDLFSERDDIPKRFGWGEGTTCYNSALILHASKITVGHHTWIGPDTILDGSAGLTIGDWVTVCAGVQIYTHDNVSQTTSMGAEPRQLGPPVTIGSGVYIGPQAVITRGITIGDCAIIGAFSLVNDDVPARATVFGQPARPRSP